MHKKAFDDWAYSAPPYLDRLEGRGGGRKETKGGGNYRQNTSSPYQQFLDPPLNAYILTKKVFIPMFSGLTIMIKAFKSEYRSPLI